MSQTTIYVENAIDRLKSGDKNARKQLMHVASRRLRALAERMWRQLSSSVCADPFGDAFHQSAIRLQNALTEFIPGSLEDFLSFAALQIRRELLLLAQDDSVRTGLSADAATIAFDPTVKLPAAERQAKWKSSSENLTVWTDFHSSVDKLPDIERKTFDLLWYHDLSPQDAAKLLNISEQQLRRNWLSARLRLRELLDGHFRSHLLRQDP